MSNNVLVTRHETTEETFALAVGITAAREAEIDLIMDKAHGETTDYPAAIALASKELLSPNELAYVCFHLGAFAESQRTKQELLAKLLE